jgi:hypothetical protein
VEVLSPLPITVSPPKDLEFTVKLARVNVVEMVDIEEILSVSLPVGLWAFTYCRVFSSSRDIRD